MDDVRDVKSNHPSNCVVRATTTKPKHEKWSDEGEQLFSESYIEQVGHWEANVKKKEETRRLRFQQRFHAATAYDPLDLEDQPVQQPPHNKRLQRLGRLPNTLEWARPRPVRFGSSRTTRRQASHIHSRIRKIATTTSYEEGDVTTAIESQSRWRENRKRLRRTRAGSDGEDDEAYLRYRLHASKEENEQEKRRESEKEDKWKEKEKEKDRSKGKEKEFDDVQTEETEKERREDTDTDETEKEEEEEGVADDDESIFVGDENVRSGLLPRRFPQRVTRRQVNEEDEETEGDEAGKPSNQKEITAKQNDSKQHITTEFRSTSGKRFRLKRKTGGEEALSRFSALSLTSACSSDASCSSSTANTPSFGSSSSTDENVTTVDEEDKMNMVSPETNEADENVQNVSHRKRKTRTSSEGNNFDEIGRLRRSKGKQKETGGEATDNDDDECEDDDEAKEGKSIRLFCRRRRKSRRKLLRAGRFCATDSETDEEALSNRSRRNSKSDSEEQRPTTSSIITS